MGQQQLILLVLAVIIVALAIIIGIRAFQENNVRSNSDALIQDIVTIAKYARVWKEKPEQLGGQPFGGCKLDAKCFQGVNFKKLGYGQKGSPFRWGNVNGDYYLTERKEGLGVKGCNTTFGNTVLMEFRGADPDSIVIVFKYVGSDFECSDES